MPQQTPKACRVLDCRNTTTDQSGYCEQHKSEGWKQNRITKCAQWSLPASAECPFRCDRETKQNHSQSTKESPYLVPLRYGNGISF